VKEQAVKKIKKEISLPAAAVYRDLHRILVTDSYLSVGRGEGESGK